MESRVIGRSRSRSMEGQGRYIKSGETSCPMTHEQGPSCVHSATNLIQQDVLVDVRKHQLIKLV